jgi:hypothetical protein
MRIFCGIFGSMTAFSLDLDNGALSVLLLPVLSSGAFIDRVLLRVGGAGSSCDFLLAVFFDHRQRKVGRRQIGPMAPDLKEVPARSSPC